MKNEKNAGVFRKVLQTEDITTKIKNEETEDVYRNEQLETKNTGKGKEPQQTDDTIVPENDWKKFTVLCFVSYFYYQSVTMMSFIQNEWIQHTMKEKYFPDSEFSDNVSSCKSSNHSSFEYQMYTHVQQDSARWNIYVNIALHATAFIANMILPCYTDTYGRRYLFILTLCGYTIRTAVVCIAIYLKQSLVYIVLASALEGISGGTFAYLSVSFSYVADIFKDSNKRVLGVVISEAIILFPVMISGLVSGLFVDNYGYFIPSLVCTGMVLSSFTLAILLLPETLKPELRRKPISIFAALKRPFEFYTSVVFRGKRLQYMLLILAFGFAITSTFNRSAIETLYLLGMPFCWTPTKIGYFSLARNSGQMFIGLGSVKLLQRFVANDIIAVTSSISCIASLIVEALAQSELVIYMVAVIAVFGFSMIPVIRGIMSTMTPPDKQGSVFASIAAVEVLGSIIASVGENAIYSATLSFMNGFVFLSMAAFVCVNLTLLVSYTVISRRNRQEIIYEEYISPIEQSVNDNKDPSKLQDLDVPIKN